MFSAIQGCVLILCFHGYILLYFPLTPNFRPNFQLLPKTDLCYVNYLRKFFCLSLLWRMYNGCLLSQEYDSVSHFWNFLVYLFLLFLNLSSPNKQTKYVITPFILYISEVIDFSSSL